MKFKGFSLIELMVATSISTISVLLGSYLLINSTKEQAKSVNQREYYGFGRTLVAAAIKRQSDDSCLATDAVDKTGGIRFTAPPTFANLESTTGVPVEITLSRDGARVVRAGDMIPGTQITIDRLSFANGISIGVDGATNARVYSLELVLFTQIAGRTEKHYTPLGRKTLMFNNATGAFLNCKIDSPQADATTCTRLGQVLRTIDGKEVCVNPLTNMGTDPVDACDNGSWLMGQKVDLVTGAEVKNCVDFSLACGNGRFLQGFNAKGFSTCSHVIPQPVIVVGATPAAAPPVIPPGVTPIPTAAPAPPVIPAPTAPPVPTPVPPFVPVAAPPCTDVEIPAACDMWLCHGGYNYFICPTPTLGPAPVVPPAPPPPVAVMPTLVPTLAAQPVGNTCNCGGATIANLRYCGWCMIDYVDTTEPYRVREETIYQCVNGTFVYQTAVAWGGPRCDGRHYSW